MEARYRGRDLLVLLAGLLLFFAGGSELLHREDGGSIGPLTALVSGVALVYVAWSEHDENVSEDSIPVSDER